MTNTNKLVTASNLEDYTIKVKDYISNSVSLSNSNLRSCIGADLKDEIFEMIMSKLSAKPLVNHKCHNCGAEITLDENNHLFKCRYCGSAYLVGINQINAKD